MLYTLLNMNFILVLKVKIQNGKALKLYKSDYFKDKSYISMIQSLFTNLKFENRSHKCFTHY